MENLEIRILAAAAVILCIVSVFCHAEPIVWPVEIKDINMANWHASDIRADRAIAERLDTLAKQGVENRIAIDDIANNIREITRSMAKISDSLELITWPFALSKAAYDAANPPEPTP